MANRDNYTSTFEEKQKKEWHSPTLEQLPVAKLTQGGSGEDEFTDYGPEEDV